MIHSRHRPMAAAFAAIAFAIPLAAHAALTSQPASSPFAGGDASATFLQAALPQERFVPQAVEAPYAVSTQPFLFVQSGPAQLNPLSASLRSSSDAALWNFVAMVHSQQANQVFDAVDTRVNVVLTLAPPVAAVPLPSATWLMVIALLGLAGAGTLRKRDVAMPSQPGLSGTALA